MKITDIKRPNFFLLDFNNNKTKTKLTPIKDANTTINNLIFNIPKYIIKTL